MELGCDLFCNRLSRLQEYDSMGSGESLPQAGMLTLQAYQQFANRMRICIVLIY